MKTAAWIEKHTEILSVTVEGSEKPKCDLRLQQDKSVISRVVDGKPSRRVVTTGVHMVRRQIFTTGDLRYRKRLEPLDFLYRELGSLANALLICEIQGRIERLKPFANAFHQHFEAAVGDVQGLVGLIVDRE